MHYRDEDSGQLKFKVLLETADLHFRFLELGRSTAVWEIGVWNCTWIVSSGKLFQGTQCMEWLQALSSARQNTSSSFEFTFSAFNALNCILDLVYPILWTHAQLGPVYLIESNRVEAQAQIEQANGDTIKNAKTHHCPGIKWLVFKEFNPLCNMEGAKCHKKMPTCQCCGCTSMMQWHSINWAYT